MSQASLIKAYDYLPTVHKLRDGRIGSPLESLLQVIDEQVQIVQQNTRDMLDDWFIETSRAEMVPYLGELVGGGANAGLPPGSRNNSTRIRAMRFTHPRREVANAISLQKRKGTLPVLEEIAWNMAGWYSRAIEWYPRVTQFQDMYRVRRAVAELKTEVSAAFHAMGQTVDFRKPKAEGSLEGAFGQGAFFPDFKRQTDATYPKNQKLLRLHLWRLKPMRVTQSRTRCIHSCACGADGVFEIHTLDSLGFQRAICNAPETHHHDRTRDLKETIAGRDELPLPLTINELRDDGWHPKSVYYGLDKSLAIWISNGINERELKLVPSNDVLVARIAVPDCSCKNGCKHGCNKSTCDCSGNADSSATCKCLSAEALKKLGDRTYIIDPEKGLLARKVDLSNSSFATCHYLFSADMGGGEYDRPVSENVSNADRAKGRRIRIRRNQNPLVSDLLKLALEQDARNEVFSYCDATDTTFCQCKLPNTILEISDSDCYELTAKTLIAVPDGYRLVVRAGKRCFPTIQMTDGECEPALTFELGKGSKLELDGLRIANGRIEIRGIAETLPTEPSRSKECIPQCLTPISDPTTRIRIDHCTLVPTGISKSNCCVSLRPATLQNEAKDSVLSIRHSIVGKIQGGLPSRLLIEDSIVDGQASECNCSQGQAIELTDGILRIERSTILGRSNVHEIDLAADSIFTEPVTTTRRQVGGMRFCYVKENSCCWKKPHWFTPQQYFCQPSQTADRQDFDRSSSEVENQDHWDVIRPAFTSLCYIDAGYCQLLIPEAMKLRANQRRKAFKLCNIVAALFCGNPNLKPCHVAILFGAESGSEMGVFHDLFQPQRIENLRRRIDQFTPFPMYTELMIEN